MGEDYEGYLDSAGRLRPERVDDLLFEVTSGKHVFDYAGDVYASRTPSLKERESAQLIYIRKLREGTAAGMHTRDDVERQCIRVGIFKQSERAEKARILKRMEELARAREQTRDRTQKLEFDAEILNIRQRLSHIIIEEEAYFIHAVEGFAESWRHSYLVCRCTLAGETLDEPVWRTWEDYLNSPSDSFIRASSAGFVRVSQGLPIKIIRALARCPHWRQIWKSSTESGSPLFDGVGVGWDANKRNLVWWSDFYDSVYQHPESPPEETINNDEALHEWLNRMLQKRNDDKRKSSVGGNTVYMRDGKGNRQAMVQVGGKNIQVNQGYKIRTSNGTR